MMKHFHDLKIEYKLLISHFVLIAIPTIAIILIYGTPLKEIIYTDTIVQEQALSDQTSLTVTSTMEQIPKISSTIQESALLKNILDDASYYNEESYNTTYQDLTAFQELIDIQSSGDFITHVCIYADGLPDFWYDEDNPLSLFAPLSNTLGTYWNGIFAGSGIDELYCPSFYLSPSEIANIGDLAYITRLYSSSDETTPIYVAIYFSQSELDSLLTQNTTSSDSIFYIVNERNSIVASSDYKSVGTYIMDYDDIVSTASSYDRFITLQVLEEEVYAGCYNISGTDWYLVSILPIAPLVDKGILLIVQFVVLYSFLLGIAFFISTMLSRSITIRIKSLSDKMSSVRNGSPEKMLVPKVKDEIGDLIETYNYMSDEMNILQDAQAKAADELRIAEFNALQAQINPHFLYNTMDMINWLSQSGRNKEVTDAVQSLSRFYKLTLSKRSVISTIENEVEHVSLYVKLQNMRYENKIDFLIDIPDELMHQPIPKLTFQPVVENSITHGILEKDSGTGSIVITGWIEDNHLVILISDDGVGISPEYLPSILQGNSKNPTKGTNIGIYNTHERLKMLYGKNAGLTYRSTKNVGTEVEIRLPLTDSDT